MNTMTKTGVYTSLDGDSISFNFQTSLSASQKIRFVKSVVSSIVDEDDQEYNAIIRDTIFDFMLIRLLSDYDTSDINNSENSIDAIEQLLSDTNIVEIIKANMEVGLLDQLNTAVDKAIAYKTGIHHNPLNDALARLFSTLERKVNEIDNSSMMEMAKVFGGMTGEITPESVVNAYLNSDVHKKNMAELDEVKKKRAEFAGDLDKAIMSTEGVKKNVKGSKSKKKNTDE